MTEPEVLKAYCDKNPNAVCIGGYGFYGCCPENRKREEFIKYDSESKQYTRIDGTIVETNRTYCGRNIPTRTLNGKDYLENQIWNLSGLGHPDLIGDNLIIEAKGGLPSLQKIHTALGQLLFYKWLEPNFKLGFLFPRIWLEAENANKAFEVLKNYEISLLVV